MTRLLLVAAALVVVLAAAGVGAGAEWDMYPGAGTPIQTAIDGAGAGDTIYVYAGTYDENAMSAETAPEEVWNKTFGRTGSWAICSKPESVDELANKDGANATKSNVSINNTILYVSGKTWYVDDDGGHGIDFTKIQDAVNAATAGDTIIVKDGTYYEQVKLNKQLTIEGENRPIINAAGKPQNYGILIDHTNGCVIRGFEVKPSTEVEVGIYLYYSHSNQIIDNIASNHCYGIAVVYSNDNIANANVVYDNLGGIGLWYSTGNNISNNIAHDNYGSGGEDSGNIGINWANNNVIMNNTVYNTTAQGAVGIGIYDSDNCIVTDNKAQNNLNGICLKSSTSNHIYHNYLIDNEQNAHDNIGNSFWDNGYPSGGNYWSDYTGDDTNRDGIGDDPYDIPGGESVDRYPLTGIRWVPPAINRSRLGINTHWNHWADDLPTYRQKIKNFRIVRDQAWWAGLETSDLTGSEWNTANWSYLYNAKTLCGKEIPYQSGLDNLVKLYQDDDSPELLLLLNLKNNEIKTSLKWEVTLEEEIPLYCEGVFALANGILYVSIWEGADGHGKLYALDASTGSEKWSFDTGAAGMHTPAVANGIVYVCGWKNKMVYALDAATGVEKWHYQCGTWISSPPIIADGMLYVGVYSKLYVFGTLGTISDAPWPMSKHDAARTGYNADETVLSNRARIT